MDPNYINLLNNTNNENYNSFENQLLFKREEESLNEPFKKATIDDRNIENILKDPHLSQKKHTSSLDKLSENSKFLKNPKKNLITKGNQDFLNNFNQEHIPKTKSCFDPVSENLHEKSIQKKNKKSNQELNIDEENEQEENEMVLQEKKTSDQKLKKTIEKKINNSKNDIELLTTKDIENYIMTSSNKKMNKKLTSLKSKSKNTNFVSDKQKNYKFQNDESFSKSSSVARNSKNSNNSKNPLSIKRNSIIDELKRMRDNISKKKNGHLH
jgi:hypothetical protein